MIDMITRYTADNYIINMLNGMFRVDVQQQPYCVMVSLLDSLLEGICRYFDL